MSLGSVNLYCIVDFLDSNNVEVIPTNWLSNSTHCFWPLEPSWSPKFKHAMLSREEPSSNWGLHRVKILKYYDSYEKARSMLPTAEITSDLEEPTERVRKKNRKYQDSDSQELDSFVGPKNPNVAVKIPSPPALTTDDRRAIDCQELTLADLRPIGSPISSSQLNIRRRGCTDSQQWPSSLGPGTPQSDFNGSPTYSSCSSLSQPSSIYSNVENRKRQFPDTDAFENEEQKRFRKYVVQALKSIKVEQYTNSRLLKNLQDKVDLLQTRASPVSTTNFMELAKKFPALPAITKETLLTFDGSLRESDEADDLTDTLKEFLKYGCSFGELDDIVNHMMRRIMSDQCAFNLTWTTVVEEKQRFTDLSIRTLLFDAIQEKFSNLQEKNFGSAMTAWFKKAHDRVYRRQRNSKISGAQARN